MPLPKTISPPIAAWLMSLEEYDPTPPITYPFELCAVAIPSMHVAANINEKTMDREGMALDRNTGAKVCFFRTGSRTLPSVQHRFLGRRIRACSTPAPYRSNARKIAARRQSPSAGPHRAPLAGDVRPAAPPEGNAHLT
jgi:hypothetical protein